MAKERVERDEEDLVRLYLTDIGQYPLLTKDDEVRLAKAIEVGKSAVDELRKGGKDVTAARKRELRRTAREGEDAERTFVQSNLRLVVSIAKKYQASGPAAARPHPGGQPRPDARGREVRLAQGLQVLHLRDVVDPPGHHPRHRQHRAAPSACRSTPATRWPACRRPGPGWS